MSTLITGNNARKMSKAKTILKVNILLVLFFGDKIFEGVYGVLTEVHKVL
jgi:hypothetical protein